MAEEAEKMAEEVEKKENIHKRLEHIGEGVASTAGSYALHETLEIMKDSEHAKLHKIEAEIAAVIAADAAAFALYERHQAKKE